MTDGDGRGAPRDESVTFSLRELRELEEERLAREQQEREAAKTRALAARTEAERRAREEEARAAAAREEARLSELAKREALQRAAMEQARLEVEVRARADERERERRHEIELASLRATAVRPGFGAPALGGAAVVGLVVAGFGSFAVHMSVLAPAADRKVASVERDLASERQRSTSLQADGDREKRRSGELERQVTSLRSELETAKATCTSAPTAPRGGGGAPRTPTKRPGSGAHEEKCVDPHDPMCFAIPR